MLHDMVQAMLIFSLMRCKMNWMFTLLPLFISL